MEQQNDEIEIDLVGLFYYLKKKLLIILAAFLVCGCAGFGISQFLVTPQYTASTRMYVLNRTNENAVVSADYQTSNYMISDYTVLITGRNVTQEVIDELGLDMTTSELAEIISVTAPDDTRVLQISVVDEDPQLAADIANCVREIASEQITDIMDVDAVKLVYEAVVPEEASSPNVMRNTVLAAALGLIAAIAVFAVIYVMDDTIKTEEDVERWLGLSVMGVLPVSKEMGRIDEGRKQSKKNLKKAEKSAHKKREAL